MCQAAPGYRATLQGVQYKGAQRRVHERTWVGLSSDPAQKASVDRSENMKATMKSQRLELATAPPMIRRREIESGLSIGIGMRVGDSTDRAALPVRRLPLTQARESASTTRNLVIIVRPAHDRRCELRGASSCGLTRHLLGFSRRTFFFVV